MFTRSHSLAIIGDMSDNDSLTVAPTAAPDNLPTATPPPASPVAAPPPAATIVVEGTRSERELELERELESTRAGQRAAELKAAYAEDKARRLMEIQSRPPAPRVKRSGFTLLHESEA